MGFQYRPEDAVECMKAGEYDAVLSAVDYKTSKAGNDMAVAAWTVYEDSGKERTLKDYVVNPNTLFRLKQIARAMGKLDSFEAGNFQLEDHIGERIRVKLKVEQQSGYPDQNKIHAYLESNGNPVAAGAVSDKGIPF